MPKEIEDPTAELQRNLQREAPTEEIPASKENSGWFQPGNTASLRHGEHSQRVAQGQTPQQSDALALLPERTAGILADLGGKEHLSTVVLGLVERHARLELIEAYLWNNIDKNGVLTAKGRQRAALTAYLEVTDRLRRSAITLGLERRTKPTNPIDAIRNAVIEANR
jgi:hypothetical protein